MANNINNNFFEGFSKLDRHQRFKRLLELGFLTEEDVALLSSDRHLSINLAEKFIENVIGYFPMPLGVAVNFRIDQRDYVIPMAVEETSIIAAASKTAKWVRNSGEITTENLGLQSIGQIHFAKVNNFSKLQQVITQEKDNLIQELNSGIAKGLTVRGGGVTDMELRSITRPDGAETAVVHVLVDTCDAMGANIIVQICEYLKKPLEYLTQERVTMCILSNLNDKKLTRATAIIRNIDPRLGQDIEEASLFAEIDPYRAATNNKGALNGMDAVLIATGNDWRAVEAGVHAYAARTGQYRSITQWRMQGKDLVGTLEAPICVGIVGGVTQLHPVAKMNLQMLNVKSANDLARITAAVGLIQNLGAIHALTTFGFIEGHMKLHIDNLTLSAGADESEIPLLKKRLEELLVLTKRLSLKNAIEALKEIRENKPANNTLLSDSQN